LVRNWHALAWDSVEQIKKRRSVKSDEAYTREVLGEMANARNLLVINDEAHRAWQVNWETEGKNRCYCGIACMTWARSLTESSGTCSATRASEQRRSICTALRRRSGRR
jgi:hypothetical protein